MEVRVSLPRLVIHLAFYSSKKAGVFKNATAFFIKKKQAFFIKKSSGVFLLFNVVPSLAERLTDTTTQRIKDMCIANALKMQEAAEGSR